MAPRSARTGVRLGTQGWAGSVCGLLLVDSGELRPSVEVSAVSRPGTCLSCIESVLVLGGAPPPALLPAPGEYETLETDDGLSGRIIHARREIIQRLSMPGASVRLWREGGGRTVEIGTQAEPSDSKGGSSQLHWHERLCSRWCAAHHSDGKMVCCHRGAKPETRRASVTSRCRRGFVSSLVPWLAMEGWKGPKQLSQPQKSKFREKPGRAKLAPCAREAEAEAQERDMFSSEEASE